MILSKNTVVSAGYAALLWTTAASADCGQKDLKGAFGFAGSSNVQQFLKDGVVRFDPYTEIGLVTYDGSGNATLNAIASFHGTESKLVAKGTYEVKPACTAAVTWVAEDGKEIGRYLLVIVQSGNELETLDVRSGPSTKHSFAISFVQKRQ
jgi:hypothetical protein